MNVKLSNQKFKIDSINSLKLNYQFVLKKYLNTLENKALSKDYIARNSRELKLFFKYLWSQNILNIKKVTNEKIYEYINTLQKFSQGTRYNIVSKIRNFLKFMYVYKYTKIDLSLIIPRMKINHNNKIPHTIWTSKEINLILSSIDRDTIIGKRDYTIFLMMSKLGVRFSDIKNMKFKNIDWKMNVITIIQSKTNKYVTLPLLNDIGLTLIDYIKSRNPNANSQYIFLNKNNQKLKNNFNFYSVFQKYLKLSNIDISNKKRIGTYSLRHSLATTLLQNRTPLSTISNILGHTNIDNTAIYLKVDIPSLRECCIDLEVVTHE